MGKQYQVFISYSSIDSKIVDQIISVLKDNKLSFFLDKYDLKSGGEFWLDQLYKGILNSQCILLLVSTNSIKSEYVQKEIKFAHEKGVPIIGLCIDKEIPSIPDKIAFFKKTHIHIYSEPSEDEISKKWLFRIYRDILSFTRNLPKDAAKIASVLYFAGEEGLEKDILEINLRIVQKISKNDLPHLLSYLEKEGFIETLNYSVKLTDKGWEYLSFIL